MRTSSSESTSVSEWAEGHEEVYRVTATGESGVAESRYYLSAYKARGWRDRLRGIGASVVVGVVAASDFTALDDDALDARVGGDRRDD